MTSCVAGVGLGDVADDLRRRDPLGQKRERHRRVVAGLHVEPLPVDRAAVEPRRRAGLEPAEREAAARASVRDRPSDGASPTRPAGIFSSPIWIRPPRNVPVVSTTRPAAIRLPSPSATPHDPAGGVEHQILGRALDDVESRRIRRGCPPSRGGRACGRPGRAGPRTAGPLLRFSMRNWMPARSIARPMTPSSASISRTRWPLASPPIAGLHDISPIVARSCVSSAVRAPSRAAAAAASHPACPPPTTTTS